MQDLTEEKPTPINLNLLLKRRMANCESVGVAHLSTWPDQPAISWPDVKGNNNLHRSEPVLSRSWLCLPQQHKTSAHFLQTGLEKRQVTKTVEIYRILTVRG